MSRAEFLRGRFGARSPQVRPPWSREENAFVEQCTRCDDCAEACPTGIIFRGPAGFPTIDFSQGACTFCGKCAESCATGALSREAWSAGERPWTIKAEFTSACLNHGGVFCRTCGDHCWVGAIRFRPQTGGAFLPALDEPRCTGCGACRSACPAGAVSFRPRPES